MGNHFDTVKLLVSKGAQISSVNKGRSPIQVACGNSNREIIEYLLDHGADLSVGQDSEIGSPLHWSVGEHRVEISRLLLEHGADVNMPNMYGVTPLILAAAGTDSAMIKLLLEFHADPTVRKRAD